MHPGGAAEWTFRLEPARDTETIRARTHGELRTGAGRSSLVRLRNGLVVEKNFERDAATKTTSSSLESAERAATTMTLSWSSKWAR